MVFKILLILLCFLHISIHCQGRPLSKRTVSEVQLMHNLGQYKQVQERREWLQIRLRGIHNPAARDGSSEETDDQRRLRPEELTELNDMTAEEIQHALDFLEKFVQSKQS